MTEEEKIKIKIQFGKKINDLNKSQDAAYRHLALTTDIDSADIAKYERGDRNPTLLTICELIDLYNVEEFDIVKIRKIKVTKKEIDEAMQKKKVKQK